MSTASFNSDDQLIRSTNYNYDFDESQGVFTEGSMLFETVTNEDYTNMGRKLFVQKAEDWSPKAATKLITTNETRSSLCLTIDRL